MTCQRIKTRPMSLWQAKEDAGSEHGWSKPKGLTAHKREQLQRQQEAIEKETMLPAMEFWTCGDSPTLLLCRCGYESDRLCDYPMGEGKTCDAPLCQDCHVSIGKDLDLCRVHATMWANAPRIHSVPNKPEGE